MEEMIGFLIAYLIICAVIGFVSMAISVTAYVMHSLGLYTIAKRRGISKPWLAWIPIGTMWITGCISDQYRYVVKGEKKSKRKILLWLGIGQIVCMTLFYVLYFSIMFNGIFASISNGDPEQMVIGMLSGFGGMMLLYLPMIAISITTSVFLYMSLYDLFTSCEPEHNVLFLVLSILFGIHPFFIFFIRKKDLGMPPRRQEPVPALPPQNGWQPPQQNWQPNP